LTPDDTLVRLDRLLSERGYATRRELREFLGRKPPPDAPCILISGRAGRDPEEKVRAREVTFNDEPLDPPLLYLMLHKPAGYTCSHDERDGLVYDLLLPRYLQRNPKPATVGRLDKDTTGLLILTDDGQALHRLTSPRHKVPKTYEVDIEQPLSEEDAERLRQGGLLLEGEDKPLLPCDVEICSASHIRLTLYEGRYHQVKRTLAALANQVTFLHRSHFGPLAVGHLQPGQYRPLSPEELAQLLP